MSHIRRWQVVPRWAARVWQSPRAPVPCPSTATAGGQSSVPSSLCFLLRLSTHSTSEQAKSPDKLSKPPLSPAGRLSLQYLLLSVIHGRISNAQTKVLQWHHGQQSSLNSMSSIMQRQENSALRSRQVQNHKLYIWRRSKNNYSGCISLGGKSLLLLPRTFLQTAMPRLGSSSNSCPFHHSQLSLLALLWCSTLLTDKSLLHQPTRSYHAQPVFKMPFLQLPHRRMFNFKELSSKACHLISLNLTDWGVL